MERPTNPGSSQEPREEEPAAERRMVRLTALDRSSTVRTSSDGVTATSTCGATRLDATGSSHKRIPLLRRCGPPSKPESRPRGSSAPCTPTTTLFVGKPFVENENADEPLPRWGDDNETDGGGAGAGGSHGPSTGRRVISLKRPRTETGATPSTVTVAPASSAPVPERAASHAHLDETLAKIDAGACAAAAAATGGAACLAFPLAPETDRRGAQRFCDDESRAATSNVVSGGALGKHEPVLVHCPRHGGTSVDDRAATPADTATAGSLTGVSNDSVVSATVGDPTAGTKALVTGSVSSSAHGFIAPSTVTYGRSPATSNIRAPQYLRMHPEAPVALPSPNHPGPTAADFCGKTLQQIYKLKEKVGEGTYGEVRRASRLSPAPGCPNEVAIKRIKALEGLDGFPITSVREVVALKHLATQLEKVPRHRDRFVELIKVVLDDEHKCVCLVFPFLPHSLQGLFQRGPQRFALSEWELSYVFFEILSAVEALHDMGIMHRDLKLDNVLLDGNGRVQLCDFGLSVPTTSGRSHLTPGMIHHYYRPPEMLLGSGTYDTSVDIWSVGCMLAQWLLREPPFLVRDQERQGGELAQLEVITHILGPVSVTHDLQHVAIRKLGHAIERSRCVEFLPSRSVGGSSAVPPQNRRRFSEHLKRQCPRGSSQPLSWVSNELCDVLDCMLEVNANQRQTASRILNMAFFSRMKTPAQREHAKEAVASKLRMISRPSHSHLMQLERQQLAAEAGRR